MAGISDEPVKFWFLTDFHLAEGIDSIPRFVQMMDRLALETPGPSAILLGGDICLHLQEDAGDAYERAVARLDAPLFHAVGNHDLFADRGKPLEEFERRFGAPDSTADVQDVKVIVLDTCQPHPELTGWQNVQGFVSADTLAWLDEVLADATADTPIVLVSHIPLRTTFTNRRTGSELDRLAWHVRNAGAVVERLRRFERVIVLQGHLHENERIRDGTIEFCSTGAVCGAWWDRKGHPTNVDSSPKGYRRVLVPRSGPIQTEYVSLDADHTGSGHAVVQSTGSGAHLFVNVYDAPSDARLEARLDELSPWQLGQLWTETNPASRHRAAHVWRCEVAKPLPNPLGEICHVRIQCSTGPVGQEQTFELPLRDTAAHPPEAAS